MTTDRSLGQDGVVVGLIAYASVAVFYTAFDVLASRGMLYTVDLLGKALFRGLRDPAVLQLPIRPDLSTIFWYNALHLVLSVAIGLVVVRLVAQAERQPAQVPLVLALLVAGFLLTILAVGALTAPIRPLLPWWSIVAANVLAVVLAGSYLLRKRPAGARKLIPFAT